MNLREFIHLVELRTAPQGHSGYRALCQAMFKSVKGIHPKIAEQMTYVDMSAGPALARLEAEKAKRRKLDELEKNKEA